MGGDVAGELEHSGYAVVEGLLGDADIAGIRAALSPVLAATPFGDNSFVGRRTRRAFGLPAKTRALDVVLLHPLVLDVLDRVLGSYLLSTAVAVEIHPGETAQTVHTDGSAWPVPVGTPPFLVNAIWSVDDFTDDNGGTRLVPASHRHATPPDEAVETVTMPAGSVLLYLGSLWHGGGANATDRPRLGLITGYLASWLRPQENFTLTCPPDVARPLPRRLQSLLGYSLHAPFVGHVDGRDPRTLLG